MQWDAASSALAGQACQVAQHPGCLLLQRYMLATGTCQNARQAAVKDMSACGGAAACSSEAQTSQGGHCQKLLSMLPLILHPAEQALPAAVEWRSRQPHCANTSGSSSGDMHRDLQCTQLLAAKCRRQLNVCLPSYKSQHLTGSQTCVSWQPGVAAPDEWTSAA